jgi:hypothetical protein
MANDFKHLQAAHCENGVTANLLQTSGVKLLTEPLVFGIGSGLFFVYLPFLKINNGPAIAFRTMPGFIFKRTCSSLGIPVIRKKFSSEKKAMQFLEDRLSEGQPVGCQVGVYYLSYFPKEYRFHFNAHNLIVYGKEGDHFKISDPVMEDVTTLSAYELERVRFAKGALAPRGQIYYPQPAAEVTEEKIRNAIRAGIKRNVRDMLHIPGGIAGVKGIRYTGNRIKQWRDKLGLQKAGLYLAQLVRMQEEIGTGGGGFRYIYAAFLQQANQFHKNEELLSASAEFTKAGDLWRSAAVQASGIYKGRLSSQQDFNVVADHLYQISEIEKKGFEILSKIRWS